MAILAISFGIWLWKAFGFNGAWLHYKMAFIFLLIIYHLISGKLLLNIIKNKNVDFMLFKCTMQIHNIKTKNNKEKNEKLQWLVQVI